jgi:dTDP-4-dehydrorhamnose 3,5-epimerase
MAEIIVSERIADVAFVQLKAFADERGRFTEIFRKEWFPQRSWQQFQMNHSVSVAGVLRGLHYHFQQIDYWYVPQGRILVGLADLRRSSPTHGQSQLLEIGDNNRVGIYIPSGVAHGYLALTDATLMYVVDQYYNPQDEFGVAWNEPAFALNWGVDAPVVSERDQKNPRWQDIATQWLPE